MEYSAAACIIYWCIVDVSETAKKTYQLYTGPPVGIKPSPVRCRCTDHSIANSYSVGLIPVRRPIVDDFLVDFHFTTDLLPSFFYIKFLYRKFYFLVCAFLLNVSLLKKRFASFKTCCCHSKK